MSGAGGNSTTSGGSVSPLTTRGDVYTYTTEDARLAAGTFSNALTIDKDGSTGWKSRRNWVTYYDDFLHWQAGDWSRNSSGTGAGSTFSVKPADADHPGQWKGSTGTTTTGVSRLQLYEDAFRVGGGKVRFETCIKLDTLSDGTNTYTVIVGFNDNTAGDAGTDGVYFKYTHGTYSGNWGLITRLASTETTSDSTVAASTSWVNLAFEINAAGSLVTYYINGTSVGTSATNIPTSTTGITFSIKKSLGTTSRDLYADYMDLNIELTNQR